MIQYKFTRNNTVKKLKLLIIYVVITRMLCKTDKQST